MSYKETIVVTRPGTATDGMGGVVESGSTTVYSGIADVQEGQVNFSKPGGQVLHIGDASVFTPDISTVFDMAPGDVLTITWSDETTQQAAIARISGLDGHAVVNYQSQRTTPTPVLVPIEDPTVSSVSPSSVAAGNSASFVVVFDWGSYRSSANYCTIRSSSSPTGGTLYGTSSASISQTHSFTSDQTFDDATPVGSPLNLYVHLFTEQDGPFSFGPYTLDVT